MKTKKLVSIGIDVGSANGAVGVIDDSGKILLLSKVPTVKIPVKSKRIKSKLNKETGKFEKDFWKRTWVDFKEMGNLLRPFKKYNTIYTIEKVSVRSGEGEPNSFVFGNSLGVFQGLYSFLEPIEYYEPLPAEWKKELKVTSDKETSIKLAESIFETNLKEFQKTGKLDDLAEALLLAFFGLKKYIENKKENI